MSESSTPSRSESEYANKLAGMCEMLIKVLEEVDNKGGEVQSLRRLVPDMQEILQEI